MSNMRPTGFLVTRPQTSSFPFSSYGLYALWIMTSFCVALETYRAALSCLVVVVDNRLTECRVTDMKVYCVGLPLLNTVSVHVSPPVSRHNATWRIPSPLSSVIGYKGHNGCCSSSPEQLDALTVTLMICSSVEYLCHLQVTSTKCWV